MVIANNTLIVNFINIEIKLYLPTEDWYWEARW